jgi:hypothetical protein
MHARGLRLRGVLVVLAIAHSSVLPSTMLNDSRHSGRDHFAAQYPACMCPCQCFDGSLTADHAQLGGRMVS